MEGSLKVDFFLFKNASIGWRAEQSGATQSSHIDRGLWAKPLSLGGFFDFSGRNYFNVIWITFRMFLKLFE